ncbi:hypothetical protein [Actinoplanes sp. CA-252034]|uniref:hypothetical protein n=1 Tax=Actinoplanes sp. CA-252034 TaxID=3239906 RepID=UPI003D96A5D7
MSLRQTAPQQIRTGQVIAVDEGDLVELIGQYAGREQSRNSSAKHDSACWFTAAHFLSSARSFCSSQIPRRFGRMPRFCQTNVTTAVESAGHRPETAAGKRRVIAG